MVENLIKYVRGEHGSDLHLTYGEPPCARIYGKMKRLDGFEVMTEQMLEDCARELAEGAGIKYDGAVKEYDFCYVAADGERQRVNLFRQKGRRGAVLRMLNPEIPTIEGLGLPGIFREIASLPRGLVLVTGPTGSGKTTTLAAMVDYINQTRAAHILTIEDPIEYEHHGKRCIINQRELGTDVDSFSEGLRAALREDPDIILVGELRDLETISAAITAAETGHLVLGTLHTSGAAKTVDRIIDVFPPYQQQQVRVQLATVLRAVVTQTLLPKIGGGRVPAFEVMLVNDAVSNLIREGKTFQINTVMQTNTKNGMVLLDMYLAALVKKNQITAETAAEVCVNKEDLQRMMSSSFL